MESYLKECKTVKVTNTFPQDNPVSVKNPPHFQPPHHPPKKTLTRKQQKTFHPKTLLAFQD